MRGDPKKFKAWGCFANFMKKIIAKQPVKDEDFAPFIDELI
jgi:hypothetical protein